MSGKIPQIVEALADKVCLKQDVYSNTLELFAKIKAAVKLITAEIHADDGYDHSKVTVEMLDVSQFEFQLKIGSDLIAFIMQTNVFAFPSSHDIFKQKYIKQNKERAYFGQVMIYNFLADSIKYNRVQDVGYLIERIFVNIDNHFYVEGLSNLNYAHLDVSKNELTDEHLRDMIDDAILLSINTDLVMSTFTENFKLTIEQKQINRSVTLGTKLGFQMSKERKSPPIQQLGIRK